MMMRNWSWLGMTAAICVAGGLWMGHHGGGAAAAENAATTPSAIDMDATAMKFDGVFAPANSFEVRINPRRYHDDLIINKAAVPGAKIARGDVLLELHRQPIDEQIASARNDVAIAQANLAKANADIKLGQQGDDLAMTNAQNDLANVQTNLKRWDDIEAGDNLVASNLEVKMHDLSLQNHTDELDQLRKMYKSEDLTNQTADIVMKQAIGELDLSKISDHLAHDAADRKEQIDAPVRRQSLVAAVAQQGQALAQLRAAQTQEKTLRETAVVSAQFALDAAKQKLAELIADHNAFVVTSPIDGIVEYGSFDHGAWHEIDPSHLAPGEKIQADQILMTVYMPGKLELFAQCPESQIALVQAGAKAKIFPTALPKTSYDGKCRAVSIIGQTKGTQQMFEVVIDLPPVDARLAPGFNAKVDVEQQSASHP